MIKQWLIIGGLALIVLGVLFLAYKRQQMRDTATVSTVLNPDTAEKLIIDPGHHSLIVISPKGTEVLRLPDRPSSIEILKTGKLRLVVPQYGFEHRVFVGIGYGDQLNDYIGMDFYYFKLLDVGCGFAFDRNLRIRSIGFPITISYNVWHNLRFSLGVEPFGSHQVHGIVSVRI